MVAMGIYDYRRPVLRKYQEIYGWSLISFKFLRGLCAYVNIRSTTSSRDLTTAKLEPFFKFLNWKLTKVVSIPVKDLFWYPNDGDTFVMPAGERFSVRRYN